METILNKYLGYTNYAAKISDEAYSFGEEIAKRVLDDNKHILEAETIVIDSIMNAFATAKIKAGMKIRMDEKSKES